VMLLAVGMIASAQQPKKVPRIVYLSNSFQFADSARYEAFRRGLRELGYVGGKNVVIEYRSSDGKPDRLPALLAELVRLNVDVIVTGGPSVTRVAKEATVTIPIIFAQDGDPVGSGHVASLAGLAGTSLDCPRFPRS
jgi:putative tryptophan/tyrosine transport system substrate-binding protein